MRTVLLAGLVACASPTRIDSPPEATGAPRLTTPAPPATSARRVVPAPAKPASCVDDGTPYDLAVMKQRVEYLAGKDLDGRVPGTDGDRATRTFIAERFACLGLRGAGEGGDFELPFEVEGKTTANVVGYIPGTDPKVGSEIIYVGAHHDHEGHGHFGANDNASGVVGLLAVAQAIRQRKMKPHRTIVFATFGAEELGMVGSYYLAAHPPKELPNAKVVQFINLDMIGSHSSRGLVAAMGARPKLASRPFVDRLARTFPRLNIAAGGIARGSDYEPLCKLGVPYVFLWTPDARCYHRACDTPDRIDYKHMVDIAAFAGALTAEMADTGQDLAGARTRYGCGV